MQVKWIREELTPGAGVIVQRQGICFAQSRPEMDSNSILGILYGPLNLPGGISEQRAKNNPWASTAGCDPQNKQTNKRINSRVPLTFRS